MSKNLARAAVLGVAAFAAVVSLSGGAVAAPTAYAPLPLPTDSVGPKQIQTAGVWGGDIHDNTIPWSKLGFDLRQHITASDVTLPDAIKSSTQIKAGAVDESDLSTALQTKINAVGPTYLANWGEIFRNTIKSGHAELGASSAGEALNITTPSAADAAAFGNEADFAGKPVALTAVKYEVFTTGENAALGDNMPSIKIEISNPSAGATYTTLVYAPANSTSNAWTAIDAKADTGNHWGFTGTWFNADPTRCGMNGTRCTLADALAVLGPDAKFISAGVGKGRDYEFHGAVRSLTINATTYKFTAGGVLAN